MPELTGVALAREVTSIRPEIPTIICTGFSQAITPESAKEMGFKEFVLKPVVARDLALAARRAIDGKSI